MIYKFTQHLGIGAGSSRSTPVAALTAAARFTAFPTSSYTSWIANPTAQPPNRHETSPPPATHGLAALAGHPGSSPRRPIMA